MPHGRRIGAAEKGNEEGGREHNSCAPCHWNEYIFSAYTAHQDGVIFLTGKPDIRQSPPPRRSLTVIRRSDLDSKGRRWVVGIYTEGTEGARHGGSRVREGIRARRRGGSSSRHRCAHARRRCRRLSRWPARGLLRTRSTLRAAAGEPAAYAPKTWRDGCGGRHSGLIRYLGRDFLKQGDCRARSTASRCSRVPSASSLTPFPLQAVSSPVVSSASTNRYTRRWPCAKPSRTPFATATTRWAAALLASRSTTTAWK